MSTSKHSFLKQKSQTSRSTQIHYVLRHILLDWIQCFQVDLLKKSQKLLVVEFPDFRGSTQLSKYEEMIITWRIEYLFSFTTYYLEAKAEWMIAEFRIFKSTGWRKKQNGSLIAEEILYTFCRPVFWKKKEKSTCSLLDGSQFPMRFALWIP